MTRHTKSIIRDVDNFQVNVRNIDSTISLEVVDSALNVVRSPKSLEGREFVWVWNENNGNVAYRYRVIKLTKQLR